jgi:hypothetical protein
MQFQFSIRQMLWLTTVLAAFLTIPILLFRFGGEIAATAYLALVGTLVWRRYRVLLSQVRGRRHLIEIARLQSIHEQRLASGRKSSPRPTSNASQPQSGDSQ